MVRPHFMLCFVSALLLGALCARAAEQKYVKYDDPKGRFHMDHPEEWKQRDPVGPDMVVAFLHAQAGFSDNMNIAIMELPSEISEDNMDKAIQRALARQLPDFHLVSDEPADVSGHHTHRMVYTATINNRELLYTLVGLIRGRTNYRIAFVTLPKRQKELEPVIDHVLKSFKLEEKEK